MLTRISQAKAAITDLIRQGRAKPGSILPLSAELAKLLNHSEATIKRALVELARDGVVRRVKRKGTIVSEDPRLGRVALVLSGDDHLNGLVAGETVQQLHAVGFDVEVVPLTGDQTYLVQRFDFLRKNPRRIDMIIALEPHWRKTWSQAAKLFDSFPNRVIFQLFGRHDNSDENMVTVDYIAGARQLVEHLHQLGHRHIAVAGDDYQWSKEIVQACRQMMQLVGGTCVGGHFFADDAAWIKNVIKKQGVTALWAFNDIDAVNCLNTLHQLSIAVPGKVSLIGRNDTPWAMQCRPNLTTLSINPPAVAQALVQALINRLSPNPGLLSWVTLVEPQLVVRESTDKANLK